MHTILVVDDQRDVRDALGCMLEARGFHVLTAEDGRAALHIVRQEPCDAALIDMDMPDMNGVELCRVLRSAREESGRPLRVALITGFLDSHIAEAARAAGVCAVLTKPISMAQL